LPDPGNVLLVEDLEDHAESVLQLVIPLQKHRRWTGHHDILRLLAEQEFPGDQASLDCLAEADVVGDEQIDPRQAEGFMKRLELIRVNPDASSERRLKQISVGRCHAIPLEGVQVRREQRRRVEPLLCDPLPSVLGNRLGIDLLLPQHFERLALGVVIEA
jgi:hypothetical protein